MSGTMDNGLGRRPLLALEPPHRILANVPQTGSISREHWDLPDQARKLVQISSSSGQAGRQVGTVGSGLRPLTDRKIRSKGLYFLILLVVRSVVGVPVLCVRQLRQIFCVLIKHGLRRYLSPGPGPVGSGWAFAYSVPDLQPLPFCCQRIWQWALPVVLPRTVPRNMPRIALRYNINVVTLRSIFPPWHDMQILTDIIFQYLCVKSVSARRPRRRRSGEIGLKDNSNWQTNPLFLPGSGMPTERDQFLLYVHVWENVVYFQRYGNIYLIYFYLITERIFCWERLLNKVFYILKNNST